MKKVIAAAAAVMLVLCCSSCGTLVRILQPNSAKKVVITPGMIGSVQFHSEKLYPYDLFDESTDTAEQSALKEKVLPLLNEKQDVGNVLYTYEHELIQYEFELKEAAKEFPGGPYNVHVILNQDTCKDTVFVYYMPYTEQEIAFSVGDTGAYAPIYTRKPDDK